MPRSRSRSPREHRERRRARSRSPGATRRHHRLNSHDRATIPKHQPHPGRVPLPFKATTISKHDFGSLAPMFASYLDIQKRLVLEELTDAEVKGRWKSFVGKWNRGELAEGWYDPATLRKAQATAPKSRDGPPASDRSQKSHKVDNLAIAEDGDLSSEEDIVGPALPGTVQQHDNGRTRPGPSVPNSRDLELKREYDEEAFDASREDIRYERKLDRRLQKDRLEDLAPRAEAGSKDRMLEKKREKADSNRAFAAGKTETGGVEDVPESDLFGGEDGGIEGYKKQKNEMERKKNERELRKEETLRARREDREERIREYRAKEEQTMSGLVALARARFG